MSRIALSFALLFASAISGCGETPEVYYRTSDEAVSDGAVARGWVPAWLPKSAVDIHEIHNLDTNRSMLAFRFNSEESVEFRAACERIEPNKTKEPAFNVPWWMSKFSMYRYECYVCEDGKGFLAISETLGQAYYWRP